MFHFNRASAIKLCWVRSNHQLHIHTCVHIHIYIFIYVYLLIYRPGINCSAVSCAIEPPIVFLHIHKYIHRRGGRWCDASRGWRTTLGPLLACRTFLDNRTNSCTVLQMWHTHTHLIRIFTKLLKFTCGRVFVLCLCLCNVCVCVRVFVYVLICLSVLVLVSLCVRLRVFVCVCARVRMCVGVCANTYVHLYTCVNVCAWACTLVSVGVGVSFQKWARRAMYVRVQIWTYYTNTCAFMYTYPLTHLQTYIHIYKHECIKRGTNTITYSHTLTHTHTHTQTHSHCHKHTCARPHSHPLSLLFSISRTHKSHIIHTNQHMNLWREREFQLLAFLICPLVCVCACGDTMYASAQTL